MIDVRSSAKVLWDFHNVDCDVPPKVDFVLALGSHDRRVAKRAAQLVLADQAPVLITAGGLGKVTSQRWQRTEAEQFADVAIILGVDAERIIVEPVSKNTGENITYARDLLAKSGHRAATGLLVTKPYMRYRALATARKQWPDPKWFVASPELSFDEYPTDDVPERTMIELMVGDLQRMDHYAAIGLQIRVAIPPIVWRAYDELVEAGFDRYVIKT